MQGRSRFERELADLEVARSRPGATLAGETGRPPITVTHFHVRKAINPSIRALLPDPSPGVMTPGRMAPGYVLPTDPRRQHLQGALDALLHAGSTPTASRRRCHCALALVDLTGAKSNTPVFAGHWAWGTGVAMEAGSLAKILPLFALYQLRFDLDTMAAQQGITKAAALVPAVKAAWRGQGLSAGPDVHALFRIEERRGDTVVARLRRTHDVHHNHVARALIVSLGFGYIGSVALQSGLFDPAQGGLWLETHLQHAGDHLDGEPLPQRRAPQRNGAGRGLVLHAAVPGATGE